MEAQWLTNLELRSFDHSSLLNEKKVSAGSEDVVERNEHRRALHTLHVRIVCALRRRNHRGWQESANGRVAQPQAG